LRAAWMGPAGSMICSRTILKHWKKQTLLMLYRAT